MHFTLKDLELFVQIAEQQSLTKGAQKVSISLAAASARLKTLEIQLNCSLFHRESRGVSLTPNGEVLLTHAKIVLFEIQKIKKIFLTNPSTENSKIRLMANTTAITEFLPGVLAQFMAERSGISFDLKEGVTHEVTKSVLENSTDIGIVAGPVDTSGLQAICFSQDELALVIPESHVLRNLQSISFNDTLKFAHVGIEANSTLHLFLEAIIRQLDTKIAYRIHMPNFKSMCQAIEAGVGVGIMPKSVALTFKKSMNISIIKLSDNWAIRERKVIFHNSENLSKIANDFINKLLSYNFD